MEIFGWIATVIVSVQFMPQLIKSIKTKKVDDISFLMAFLIFVGSIFWALHAWFNNDKPLLTTNAIVLIISGLMLYFKVKYDKK